MSPNRLRTFLLSLCRTTHCCTRKLLPLKFSNAANCFSAEGYLRHHSSGIGAVGFNTGVTRTSSHFACVVTSLCNYSSALTERKKRSYFGIDEAPLREG
jgi:hypothetical protein